MPFAAPPIIVAPSDQAIAVSPSDVFTTVRCLALCRVLDVPLTSAHVKWMSEMQKDEYADGRYFSPYVLKQRAGLAYATVGVAPWALAGLRYFGHLAGVTSNFGYGGIDPAQWYTGLLADMRSAYGSLDPQLQHWIEVAHWLYTEEGAESVNDSAQLAETRYLFEQVRLAQADNKLITDRAKIRRIFGV